MIESEYVVEGTWASFSYLLIQNSCTSPEFHLLSPHQNRYVVIVVVDVVDNPEEDMGSGGCRRWRGRREREQTGGARGGRRCGREAGRGETVGSPEDRGSYTVYVSNCIIENDVSWSSSRPFQTSKTPSSRYPRGVRRHTTTLLIILERLEAIQPTISGKVLTKSPPHNNTLPHTSPYPPPQTSTSTPQCPCAARAYDQATRAEQQWAVRGTQRLGRPGGARAARTRTTRRWRARPCSRGRRRRWAGGMREGWGARARCPRRVRRRSGCGVWWS
jgi:hypothetical protein